jgi:hypothetical protein
MSSKQTKPLRVINPFVVFYPKDVDVRTINKQGDGPPNPSQSAETLKPNSRPGDRPSFKNKALKEEDLNLALYRYLHKRRMNWFYRIDESTPIKDFLTKLAEFVDYAAKYLEIQEMPEISLKPTEKNSTFASWTPNKIEIAITERHPMDVFRSVAHELVHQKQHEDNVLHTESGKTGSDHENEANALAGIIMRNYAKNNPDLFELESIAEGTVSYILFGKGKQASKAKASPRQVSRSSDTTPRSRTSSVGASDDEIIAQKAKKLLMNKKAKELAKAAADDHDAENLTSGLKSHFNSPEHVARVKAYEKWKQKYNYGAPRNDPVIIRPNEKRTGKTPNQAFKGIIRGLKESICLLNKSIKSNIEYGVLCEVFDRGAMTWKKDTGISQKEYAFNRVNSFISGGKARELDKDLI